MNPFFNNYMKNFINKEEQFELKIDGKRSGHEITNAIKLLKYINSLELNKFFRYY